MIQLLTFIRSKAALYAVVVLALIASHFYAYTSGKTAAEEQYKLEQFKAVQEAIEKAKQTAKEELNKAVSYEKKKAELEKQAIQSNAKTETIIKEKVVEQCRAIPSELTNELNKLIESMNQ